MADIAHLQQLAKGCDEVATELERGNLEGRDVTMPQLATIARQQALLASELAMLAAEVEVARG